VTDRQRPAPSGAILHGIGGIAGLFFLTLGLGFMALPDVLAAVFSIAPGFGSGVSGVRGDLGGLFLGMSFFCWLGMARGRSRWLAVPLVFLVLIIAGRLIGLALGETSPSLTRSLTIEAVLVVLLIAALVLAARKSRGREKNFKMTEFLNATTLVFALVVIAALAAIQLSQKKIGMVLVERIARKIMTADSMAGLPDGLHVALCGSGAPLNDPRRAQPCVAVIVGTRLYVIDTGPGSMRKFELMRLNPGQVRGVLLTHFHSDHIGDLGELLLKHWVGGSTQAPLEVFGPPGVEKVVQGFNLAYALDSGYRVLHHGPEVAPPSGAGGAARPFSFAPGQDHTVIIDEDGLTVTAFLVDHGPVKPAVGYRFDYKGRSVVISGDTSPTPSLRLQAKGADLLVQEALQPVLVQVLRDVAEKSNRPNMAKILSDIQNYHTSPEDAARMAQEAGVRHLLFYHVLPPLPVSMLKAAFLGDAKKIYHGPITLGEDGMLFSLPAGSEKIARKWLL